MIAAILFAHVVAGDVPAQMRVLAAHARLGVALIDYDAEGKHHVVLVRGDTNDDLDVHDNPCSAGATGKKAHDALYVELKKRDITNFGISCISLPVTTRASDQGSLRVTVAADGDHQTRTISIDDVPVFTTHDASTAPVATFVVHGLYGTVALDWRDADRKFRLAGALDGRDRNGVDVTGLSSLQLGVECGVSIATNIPLENTVAVTVAYALKSKVPITEAQTTREKSVVYASEKCGDVAKAIAPKVPGGATVDKLTWKAAGNAGIVVALGESAAVR